MKIMNILLTGACLSPIAAFAQEAAEQADGVVEFVKSAAQFLPWPWNVVAVSVATAAGAVFAWKKTKAKPKEEQPEKKD